MHKVIVTKLFNRFIWVMILHKTLHKLLFPQNFVFKMFLPFLNV